jgi:hypothetical protein
LGFSFIPKPGGSGGPPAFLNLTESKTMESTNLRALEIVDGAFADLARKIAGLDRLTDDLQTSRENIQKLEAESVRIKNDVDGLERSKRVSKLAALNGSLEIEKSDNSRLLLAIQTAKSNVLAAGRGVRTLISTVLWQLLQAQKMRYTLLFDRELCLRKVPIRASDLANAGRDVVAVKELEDVLCRPKRGDEELSTLYTLKVKFEPVRAMILAEPNLALEIRNPEEPAVAEPAGELVAA